MHNATLKAASMLLALNHEGENQRNSRGGQRIDSHDYIFVFRLDESPPHMGIRRMF